jgi:phosphoadenosine phosphosulfate reductase
MPARFQHTIEQRAVDLTRRYGHLDGAALLRPLIEREFPARIAVVSSFGAESAAILGLIAEIDPATPVLFLDTRKHFAETLAYRDALVTRLGLADLRVIGPDPSALAEQDSDGWLWQRNPDRCCHLRKVLPMRRALQGFDAWITGRKRYQGTSRTQLAPIEVAEGRIRINPISTWTAAEVEAAIETAGLPRHPLVEMGYPSIGCAPCTHSVVSVDPLRAGRWAGTLKTECGIHGE